MQIIITHWSSSQFYPQGLHPKHAVLKHQVSPWKYFSPLLAALRRSRVLFGVYENRWTSDEIWYVWILICIYIYDKSNDEYLWIYDNLVCVYIIMYVYILCNCTCFYLLTYYQLNLSEHIIWLTYIYIWEYIVVCSVFCCGWVISASSSDLSKQSWYPCETWTALDPGLNHLRLVRPPRPEMLGHYHHRVEPSPTGPGGRWRW